MKKESYMLTDRDLEMIKFTNIYGRTFLPVLSRTFFNSERQARDRIGKLFNQNCVRYMDTNLLKIGRAIVLSHDTKMYLIDIGIEPKKVNSGYTTVKHNIVEQTAHYWLSKIGEIERTSVAKHGGKLAHVPDMILTLPSGGRIFIEVEMSKKTSTRYKEIFEKISEDNPSQVLYVLPKTTQVQSFAKFLPPWDKIRVIDIDTLIENIKTTGKVLAKLQAELI